MKSKTPKAPLVPIDLWNRLYAEAFRYESLDPWKIVNEDLVFAFADPGSKKLGYCCIPGKAEGFLGFSLYRGREGFEMYLQLKRQELDPKGVDVLHNHDAIVLEFTQNKKTLDKEDLAIMKEIGVEKQTFFPSFRSYLPGFKGWFLTEDEVVFLTLALKCSIKHITDYMHHSFRNVKPDPMRCPLYVPREENGNITWDILEHKIEPAPKKTPRPVTPNMKKIEMLKETKLCHDGAWEASMINTSNVLSDHVRPYLAKICMIVHQDTLLILHIKPAELGEEPEEMMSEELLFTIKKHKRIPGEILFNDSFLYESLKPLMKTLGIQGTLTDVLPATLPSRESLLQYMQ